MIIWEEKRGEEVLRQRKRHLGEEERELGRKRERDLAGF
jgi:hypothetical protein